jgi:hypothetical protein
VYKAAVLTLRGVIQMHSVILTFLSSPILATPGSTHPPTRGHTRGHTSPNQGPHQGPHIPQPGATPGATHPPTEAHQGPHIPPTRGHTRGNNPLSGATAGATHPLQGATPGATHPLPGTTPGAHILYLNLGPHPPISTMGLTSPYQGPHISLPEVTQILPGTETPTTGPPCLN